MTLNMCVVHMPYRDYADSSYGIAYDCNLVVHSVLKASL